MEKEYQNEMRVTFPSLSVNEALARSCAAAFCALLPWYAGLVKMVSPKGPELEVIARQIANAHTLFNLICTAVWLPLTPLMVRLVCRLVPNRPSKARNG